MESVWSGTFCCYATIENNIAGLRAEAEVCNSQTQATDKGTDEVLTFT